jgi:outer membrane protein TolC
LAANKANLMRTEALRDAAKDLYLPKINLSGSYIYMEDKVSLDLEDIEPFSAIDPENIPPALAPILNAPTVTDFTDRGITTSSIRGVWPLFIGGKRGAAIDIAREQHIEAAKVLAMHQQAKFEDLARIYFGVVLAAQVVETFKEVENGLAKHQHNAVKLEEQGQIAYIERLQADASLDKAKVDTKKAQRSYEIAQLALGELLHTHNAVQPSTALFTQATLPKLDTYLSRTLKTFPGLGILDSKSEQAKKLITIAKSNYLPDVFMFGNYELYQNDSLAEKIAPDWQLGVGVSVPIVDNTGRSGKVQAAHSTVEQIRHLRAQAERDLSLLVEKTYREAFQALEEYQGLESTIALAKENLRIRQKAFSQGFATSLDVVDAQMYQAGVTTRRQSAAYNHVVALAKLTALTGEMNLFSKYYLTN